MAAENTWKGLENLKNAMEKVEEFEKGRFEEEIRRIRMKKGKEIRLNPEADSGRSWYDQRWKLSLDSRSETQGPLFLPTWHSSICDYVPSSSD